jgi:hypothetical protein
MFPIGGLVGVVCGGIARSKGDQSLGLAAIVAGVVSFFASFGVAALVLGQPAPVSRPSGPRLVASTACTAAPSRTRWTRRAIVPLSR